MCKYALKHSVFFLEAAPSFSFYCPFRAPVKCAMMKGEWKRSVKHVKQPRNPRRLVVKVGTSTLTRETGSLNLQNMEHLARVLADLEGMGYQPVLVSSGAIGIGTKKLRLGERPTELRMKQAAAAVGQCRMMHIYDKLFAEYNRTVAQILLTGEDVESPVRSEHLHNTFEALLELGVIPVVNENDSVSSAEIETGQCKVLGAWRVPPGKTPLWRRPPGPSRPGGGEILAANAADLEAARAAGLRPALLDRLALDEGRIAGIVEGCGRWPPLPDPIGAVTKMDTRPNGLTIGKRRVPLGVIGIIYEARPNVTVDAAALCLKSGNAALLRGGKEAFHSNQAFVAVLRDALEEAGLPRDCVALVADTSRESANELMHLTEYLDVLIPRGGAGLIRSVVENARVPVIQTGVGGCATSTSTRGPTWTWQPASSTTPRPPAPRCATPPRCVLVDRAVARDFLPLAWELLQTKGVELRGCPETRAILGDWVKPAAEADWDTEFGDYILAVKVVSGFDEAVDFIAAHGTGHSRPSSPPTTLPPSASWTRWTPRRCTSTPPPASPTASSSAWGRRSASPPKKCMPGAPWAWRS